jgi:hypothetical protein
LSGRAVILTSPVPSIPRFALPEERAALPVSMK